jgi:hypothetical protein
MSGVAKGVKKVFKKVGKAIKKVMKNKFFKAILIGAAAIFTGGAALGAFSALGSGASLGSAVMTGISSGASAIGSAVSAIGSFVSKGVGAVKGMLGFGEAGAATLGAEAGFADAATSAAWSEGAAGLGADTLSAMGAGAEVAGGVEAAGGLVGLGGTPDFVPTIAGTGQGGAGSLMSMAQQATPTALQGATQAATQGAGSWGGSLADYAGRAWDFATATPERSRMFGNIVLGAGQGYMQSRQQQQEADYRRRMTEVPDWSQQFQLKPKHRWATIGR